MTPLLSKAAHRSCQTTSPLPPPLLSPLCHSPPLPLHINHSFPTHRCLSLLLIPSPHLRLFPSRVPPSSSILSSDDVCPGNYREGVKHCLTVLSFSPSISHPSLQTLEEVVHPNYTQDALRQLQARGAVTEQRIMEVL